MLGSRDVKIKLFNAFNREIVFSILSNPQGGEKWRNRSILISRYPMMIILTSKMMIILSPMPEEQFMKKRLK